MHVLLAPLEKLLQFQQRLISTFVLLSGFLFQETAKMEDDEVHPVLSSLLSHANSILETALTCPTGVRAISSLRVTNKSQRTAEERSRKEVIQWANQERWLLNELDNYASVVERKRTILSAREEALLQSTSTRPRIRRDVTSEEENLQQSIAELQDELFKVVDENMRKELLLQQMHYSAIALKCAFPQSDKDLPEGERKQLELLMQQRDEKSIEFLALHAKLQEIQEEEEKLQNRNREQRLRNQQLWTELKQLQGELEGEKTPQQKGGGKDGRVTNADLERKLSMNVVIREVFQALILESGVNWAKDEKLRKLMLSLDTSLPPPNPNKLYF